MLLKYFYDKELAQASYMAGCSATGEALIIDPSRDIAPYIAAAKAEGLRITHVTETHIHADYVSGSRELAKATGAKLYLSDMGDDDWKYTYAKSDDAILVGDGDRFMVGNVRLEVMHTPGHTPEHISFIFTDTAAADEPMGIFTGDFVFVGDVGRPDLLEEAAGMVGTREVGARQQFHSVQRIKDMPDYLQILPGHGAGSACGKALGALPSSTLGYEKRFNPAFQFEDEDQFVAWLLDGQPEAPRYFAHMKKVNKEGPALLDDIAKPTALTPALLQNALENNELVIDFRNKEDYATSHIQGTINVPATSTNFSTYVGWFVDYETPMHIIAPDETSVPRLLKSLQAIGVDNVQRYATLDMLTDAGTDALPLTTAADISQQFSMDDVMIIDVRGKSEYDNQHIIGAQHIPLGFLPRHLDMIPKDKPVITQCASGYRSQIAASVLRRYGYDNVVNLVDGESVWSKTLATE